MQKAELPVVGRTLPIDAGSSSIGEIGGQPEVLQVQRESGPAMHQGNPEVAVSHAPLSEAAKAFARRAAEEGTVPAGAGAVKGVGAELLDLGQKTKGQIAAAMEDIGWYKIGDNFDPASSKIDSGGTALFAISLLMNGATGVDGEQNIVRGSAADRARMALGMPGRSMREIDAGIAAAMHDMTTIQNATVKLANLALSTDALRPEYASAVGEAFGAYTAGGQPLAGMTDALNEWVYQNTRIEPGKDESANPGYDSGIKDLFDESFLAQAKFVVASTSFVDVRYPRPFDATKRANCIDGSGAARKVALQWNMRLEGRLKVTDDVTIAEVPINAGKVTFVMPKDAATAKRINAKLQSEEGRALLFDGMQSAEFGLAMPQFEVETRVADLQRQAAELGFPMDGASYPGLTGTAPDKIEGMQVTKGKFGREGITLSSAAAFGGLESVPMHAETQIALDKPFFWSVELEGGGQRYALFHGYQAQFEDVKD